VWSRRAVFMFTVAVQVPGSNPFAPTNHLSTKMIATIAARYAASAPSYGARARALNGVDCLLALPQDPAYRACPLRRSTAR
jgi:hypothetical protein